MLWRKLLHNRVACTGGVILIVLYAASCFAGFLSPYDFADGDRASSRTGPMLAGGFEAVVSEIASKDDPETKLAAVERRWTWFEGGLRFRDPSGAFSLRPWVHPVVERESADEYGDTSPVFGITDRSASFPVEFFVETPEHEVFSILGLFPVRGTRRLFGVATPPGVQGSCRVYLLGSDQQGRDVFSRILFGSQISLSVGVVCILVTMLVGMTVGGISGYAGGWFDVVAMRVVEVVLSVPDLYLMIVVGGILRELRPGGKPLSSGQTYFLIVAILALVGWAGRARVVRGMVLSLKENDYVVAARALGVPSFRIVVRHILPNTFSFAIVSATLSIPSYILGEVALSFLGLGIQDPEASWGNMLREAQQPSYLMENPWIVVPGVFIFLTVLAYNFLGDGLRDAADPKAVIVRTKIKKA